jgi:hypothetical protein
VHGTNMALVSGNICYNHLGYGYFLEDGIEHGNTIANNPGILARTAVTQFSSNTAHSNRSTGMKQRDDAQRFPDSRLRRTSVTLRTSVRASASTLPARPGPAVRLLLMDVACDSPMSEGFDNALDYCGNSLHSVDSRFRRLSRGRRTNPPPSRDRDSGRAGAPDHRSPSSLAQPTAHDDRVDAKTREA